MIDAYTIGIKLALEDGVSAGIAAVRRDLSLLDHAIESTSVELQALGRLGEHISQIRSEPGTPPPKPTPAIKDDLPGKPVLEASDPVRTPAAPRSEGNERSAPQLSPAIVPASASVIPAPEPRDTRPASVGPGSAPAPIISPRPEPLSPIKPLEPRVPEARVRRNPPAALVLSVSKEAPATPTNNPPSPPRSIAEYAPRVLTKTAELLPEPLRSSRVAAPPQQMTRVLALAPASRLEAPAAAPSSPERATEATAPRTAPRQRLDAAIASAAPVSQAEFGSTLRSTAPPTSASGDEEPRQGRSHIDRSRHEALPPIAAENQNPKIHSSPSGEIVLDGVRLGRWMGDALVNLIDRPNSGLTDIDPRATPLWPAMQGY